MLKALIFLRKLIILVIILFAFFVTEKYDIPIYFSIPVLNLAFSLISSRISGTSPKELYNFQRNEKYFSKGGMRDLLRIPVMLFSFIHDFVVWEIWGVYQLFEMIVDTLNFVKDIIYWIFYGIIWFLKLFFPFWKIVFRLVLFYLIKWPWWIFRYAYQTIRIVYNWNMLRVSLWGTFFALFIIQLFIFLDIALNIPGIGYIGIILSLIPLSWIFGEIASMRAQKLQNTNYIEVRSNFKNGLESIRGILVFMFSFVVLLLIQAGLNVLGLIPGSGIIFLGFVLNINFLINILLIFLTILIVFGTIILPSFRLYNEFNETTLKNIHSLLEYIRRRFLQYLSGLIPGSFFAIISAIPITFLVVLSLVLTLTLKNNILDIKISKLEKKRLGTTEQIDDYRLSQKIQELNYYKQFPTFNEQHKTFVMQEIRHRHLLEKEIQNENFNQDRIESNFLGIQEQMLRNIEGLSQIIQNESQKEVINQTRIEEAKLSLDRTRAELKNLENEKDYEIQESVIKIEFLERKHKLVPLIFYLSGLFIVVILTFVLTFISAYFGNFFYTTFIYRNDGTKAEWRNFIKTEQKEDVKQPLLSATLNFGLFIVIVIIVMVYRTRGFLF
jgi:hypothetical protein